MDKTKIFYKMDLEDPRKVIVAKILPRNWAQNLADQTGKSRQAIYQLARKIGRIPTIEEILSQKPGRPPKFMR